MKKLLFFGLAFLIFSFSTADTPLTKKERADAISILKDTENGVEKAIAGLSDNQLNYKANDSSWSVDGCVKHIAASEKALWSMVDQAMKSPANPEKRVNVKSTDDQVVKMLEDRSHKVKTMDPLKPENSPFKSTAEALSSFKENREKLISYIKSTQDDMRSHVVELPFASFDAYQMVLFIAAHSNRHTQQIDEVKANPDFPKN